MAGPKSFTNDEIKYRIKNICAKFVLGVDPDRLSDWLVQEDVITSDQWQRIHTENPTRLSRCRALLHHLNSIPHPKAFLVVRQALAEENHYLLEAIDNQEPESRISSVSERQTASQEKTEQQEKNGEEQKRAREADKDRLLKMQEEHEDQKRAWKVDKDRLLKMQEEHEDQKRAWKADKDRLLKMQEDIETKLHFASIEQQKLEQERKLWGNEKEQLIQGIYKLRRTIVLQIVSGTQSTNLGETS